MKHHYKFNFSLLMLAFIFINSAFSQKTTDVKIQFKYKNSPLCNWEVTLKHGDVAIGKAISNSEGVAEFKGVTIISKSVDAYGYKTHKGGDKKWDVKGYIDLNDDDYASFDFEKVIKEAGMPVAMMEAAWGLNIKDCGVISNSNTDSNSNNAKTNTDVKKDDNANSSSEDENETLKSDVLSAQNTLADNLALNKQGFENKLSALKNKKEKTIKKREKTEVNSKDYSDLTYELEDIDLDIKLTEIRLEKTNKQIDKGNLPLNKEERNYYKDAENEIKTKQDELKSNKKSGVLYHDKNTPKEVVKENATNATTPETTESENEEIKSYSNDELTAMSAFELKKLKVKINSQIGSRKVKLKTRGGLDDNDIKLLEQEIALLQQQLDQISAIIDEKK